MVHYPINRCLFLSILLVATGLLYIWLNHKPYEHFENSCSSGCGDSKNNLLPIFDPLYNAREWCKQCVLLEDHLTQPRKRCEDCCTKHILTLEALAEEACSLDKKGEYQDLLGDLAEKCRVIHRRILNNEDKHTISQDLRKIRKYLMPHCRDHF